MNTQPNPQWDHVSLKAMPYADFLQTPYWKIVAAEVKKRDGNRCRICDSGKNLEAHHRNYFYRGEDHLHMDELITLCHTCHHRHHFPAKQPKEAKQKLAKIVSFKEGRKEARFWIRSARRLGIAENELRPLGMKTVSGMVREKRRQKRMERQLIANKTPLPDRIVGDITSVEADMPPGDPIIITREILHKCQANGAFTSATVMALGLRPSGLVKGWTAQFIGKPMSREQLYAAMRGRHIYAKATMKIRRKENKLRSLLDAAFPIPPQR